MMVCSVNSGQWVFSQEDNFSCSITNSFDGHGDGGIFIVTNFIFVH